MTDRPLSKELLAGAVDEEAIALRPHGWYEDNQIELILGRRAAGLDAAARQLELDDGTALSYEKLLIATGSRARRLPDLDGWPNVHYLRTLADARALRAALQTRARAWSWSAPGSSARRWRRPPAGWASR